MQFFPRRVLSERPGPVYTTTGTRALAQALLGVVFEINFPPSFPRGAIRDQKFTDGQTPLVLADANGCAPTALLQFGLEFHGRINVSDQC